MAEQPSAALRPLSGRWGGQHIYKNWDVKSAFTTNPLANPNLQGDAASNPVETQAFIIFNRPVDQTVVSMMFNLLREYWVRRSLDWITNNDNVLN